MVKRYLAVLLLTGVLYGLSCAPGAVWQDSGLIQYRVWHDDIEGFLGLALSHPLYYLFAVAAKHLPWGEFGHRVNLLSALAGAVAVANLYLLLRLWLGREFPALLAAATLALSHTFWWHASIAETYTLWAALFTGELVMLLQYLRTRRVGYLYLLGLLNGLALAVHMLASLALLCYAAFFLLLLVRKDLRLRQAAAVAGFWVVGALPYEFLIIRHMVGSGDIAGTLASAAFGVGWRADVLNTSLSWKILKESVLFLGLNFPTPNILLFFAGLHALRPSGPTAALRRVILALLALFFVFAVRYTVADRYAFFLPVYVLMAVVLGWGVHAVRIRVARASVVYLMVVFLLLPVGIYAVAPQVAQRLHIANGTRADIPYRNDYEYFLRPWRTGYTGAERFAREALTSVEPGAVICADTTTVAPLLYVQEVEGLRPDVQVATGIVSSPRAPRVTEHTIGLLLERYPFYVVSKKPGYCPPFILGQHELAKAGVLWRVVGSPGKVE